MWKKTQISSSVGDQFMAAEFICEFRSTSRRNFESKRNYPFLPLKDSHAWRECGDGIKEVMPCSTASHRYKERLTLPLASWLSDKAIPALRRGAAVL